ncbi:MAG: peptidylprolyl isomerase [Sphingomonadaceae bacterium]|nr:peptidylprolyl isomerase [Sphingomonadaceae bacterium]
MRLKILLIALASMAAACSSSSAETELASLDATVDASEEVAPAIDPTATAATPAPDPENTLYLDLSTGGRVAIRLRPDVAPNHAQRIKTLARQGFYNGIVFHRVIEGFMAQTGDPTGTGEGGSQLPDLNAEFSRLPHVRGTVSMARATDPNSANSQFFIMFQPRFQLDSNYTAFGRVIDGMEYVDAIPRGEPPARPARIIRASVAADNIPPPTAAEIAAFSTPQPSNDPVAAIDAALAAGDEPE